MARGCTGVRLFRFSREIKEGLLISAVSVVYN